MNIKFDEIEIDRIKELVGTLQKRNINFITRKNIHSKDAFC